MDNITIDTILEYFKRVVETKQSIGAGVWIDSALKLNILKQDLDEEIALLEYKMADAEATLIKEGESASTASKLKIQSIDYAHYLKQKSKEKRIQEFIRLSKKQASIIVANRDY